MKEKKPRPKCVKLYSFGVALIVLMFWSFGVYTLDKATQHGKVPLTKANLIEAVSPISPAKTYND